LNFPWLYGFERGVLEPELALSVDINQDIATL
jgi:hypothetical protein